MSLFVSVSITLSYFLQLCLCLLWVSRCHLLCLSPSFSFSCCLFVCMPLCLFIPACLVFLTAYLSLFYYVNLSLFPLQTLSLPFPPPPFPSLPPSLSLSSAYSNSILIYSIFCREAISREACNCPLPAGGVFSSLLSKPVHGFHGSSSRGSATSTFYTSSPWKLNICSSFRLSLPQRETCQEGLRPSP